MGTAKFRRKIFRPVFIHVYDSDIYVPTGLIKAEYSK